jgi:peptidoglycan/xylan/chitin deacetylase (PgdA/CDA1 family)
VAQLDYGVFTISLDFELYWGVRDLCQIADYQQNLLGVRQAAPAMLKAFSSAGVHATWATVGLLFCQDRVDALNQAPDLKPAYRRTELSPYHYLSEHALLDPIYHFAPDLVAAIADTAGQELASHTFSHYYCLEAGQTAEAFRADLQAAQAVASRMGHHLRSLVFPRNQWNAQYLSVLAEQGFRCFRGNESAWMYQAGATETAQHHPLRRALRLLDSYLNLSGHHTYALTDCQDGAVCNFPASRFLRPYSPRLAALDGLRLQRITRAMTYAARHQQIFHLWWHPHNFGRYLTENMAMLEKIISHFHVLEQQYGMRSLNMGELAAEKIVSSLAALK